MSTVQKVIYLFLIDDSITVETQNKLLVYCKAYFTGIEVQLIHPGDSLYEKNRQGKKTVKHTLPADFITTHNIASRLNQDVK